MTKSKIFEAREIKDNTFKSDKSFSPIKPKFPDKASDYTEKRPLSRKENDSPNQWRKRVAKEENFNKQYYWER